MKRFLTAFAAACAAGLAAPAGAGLSDIIYSDDFEEPGGGEVPTCTPEAPQYPPAGYTHAYSPTLQQLWFDTTGEGIGNALAKVRLEGGSFTAMSFTREMFSPGSTLVQFFADTSNVGIGLQGADYRYVAISECAGDLRAPDNASPDPMRRSACRVLIESEGPFLYLNWGAPMNNPAVCDLDPAKTYYFNVLFDDPRDGYNPNIPCSSNGGLNNCGFRMAVQ